MEIGASPPKFFPKNLLSYEPSSVHTMGLRRIKDKPLSQLKMDQGAGSYVRHTRLPT